MAGDQLSFPNSYYPAGHAKLSLGEMSNPSFVTIPAAVSA